MAPVRQRAIGIFGRWPLFPAPQNPLVPLTQTENLATALLSLSQRCVPGMLPLSPLPSRSLPWRPPQRLDGASPAVCGGGPLFWVDLCFYFYVFRYIEISEDHEKCKGKVVRAFYKGESARITCILVARRAGGGQVGKVGSGKKGRPSSVPSVEAVHMGKL